MMTEDCVFIPVEGNPRLSQEMVLPWELHWEQPEEPRAGAAAQTMQVRTQLGTGGNSSGA